MYSFFELIISCSYVFFLFWLECCLQPTPIFFCFFLFCTADVVDGQTVRLLDTLYTDDDQTTMTGDIDIRLTAEPKTATANDA